jgi:hypothetical protein
VYFLRLLPLGKYSLVLSTFLVDAGAPIVVMNNSTIYWITQFVTSHIVGDPSHQWWLHYEEPKLGVKGHCLYQPVDS